MPLAILKAVLLWSFAINYGVLLLWFVLIAVAHDPHSNRSALPRASDTSGRWSSASRGCPRSRRCLRRCSHGTTTR